MKKMIQTRFAVILTLLVVFGLSINTQAQSKQEAADLYNKGAQLAKSNPGAAVKNFVEVVEITKKIGPDAYDLQQRAEKQIPNLQYKHGLNLYKKKKYDEAIEAMEKAVNYAEEYNNAEIKTKANKVIPQLNYIAGIRNYKQKEFSAAIEYFDQAIKLSPDYAKAYLGKGLVYKELGQVDKLTETMDKTIEVATKQNDTKTAQKASKVVSNKLLVEANKSVQDKNWSEAQDLLTKSLKYDAKDAQAHLLLTTVYNKQSNWDKAIEHGNKALEGISGDEAQAQVYFEIASAYQGKGDKAQACKYYGMAAVGKHKENAEYQMNEVLKCQ